MILLWRRIVANAALAKLMFFNVFCEYCILRILVRLLDKVYNHLKMDAAIKQTNECYNFLLQDKDTLHRYHLNQIAQMDWNNVVSDRDAALADRDAALAALADRDAALAEAARRIAELEKK
ncbi:MAG: hypothetical protein Ta2B_00690 [Termitinemataceae bacterium]|nr:MAG: hypothetical protein Ta2B_00690 [Termitinemataceae bacterium]